MVKTDKPGENYIFKGRYPHSMDEKRRISIPAKMRDHLGERAVITLWAENCLVLYPMDAWERVSDWLQSLSRTKKEARSLKRMMFSGASEVTFDKLGRILVPEYLAEHAGLEKDVVIIGAGENIEIWGEKGWERYRSSNEKKMDDILEGLEEIEG